MSYAHRDCSLEHNNTVHCMYRWLLITSVCSVLHWLILTADSHPPAPPLPPLRQGMTRLCVTRSWVIICLFSHLVFNQRLKREKKSHVQSSIFSEYSFTCTYLTIKGIFNLTTFSLTYIRSVTCEVASKHFPETHSLSPFNRKKPQA